MQLPRRGLSQSPTRDLHFVLKPNQVLLRHSQPAAPDGYATATTQALLLERAAWAQARVGDANACDRILAAVKREPEHRQPDDDPVWVYWLSQEELKSMAGRRWT